jgi:2-hydroxychromene-2-carboxylate isomerase
MKHISFYLDFVSPYAYLAFERLPQELEGLSYSVSYRPVLLGALLQQYSNPGPAGIPPKREWVFRHSTWLGHAQGIPLQMPPQHPFNPLPLLRQALACSDDGAVNRYVAGTVMSHVWRGGADALDAERLKLLASALSEQVRGGQDPNSEGPKELLRANTAAAEKKGVFGVPAFEVDGKLFWGLDGLPMLRAYLQEDPWFDAEHWDAVHKVSSGLAPKKGTTPAS